MCGCKIILFISLFYFFYKFLRRLHDATRLQLHHNLKPKQESFSVSRHSLDIGAQQSNEVHTSNETSQHHTAMFVQHLSSTSHNNANSAYQPRHRDGPRFVAKISKVSVSQPPSLSGTFFVQSILCLAIRFLHLFECRTCCCIFWPVFGCCTL